MVESIALQNKSDITETGQTRVACNGPSFSRHPKVYLSLEVDTQGHPTHVVCPYCSHVFKYNSKLADASGHAH